MLQRGLTAGRISPAESLPTWPELDGREVMTCSLPSRSVPHPDFPLPAMPQAVGREGRIGAEDHAPVVRSEPAVMEVSDVVKNLGARVRESRKESGMTQWILACRMNVPRTYISKVEMGRVVPTLVTLERFAAGLDVSVIYLLCDESVCRRDDVIAGILGDPFLAEIAQLADKLDPVHRALILRTVRAVEYRLNSA
jgi:transcriptional regulator with XRE-family HTH domain